MDNHHRPGHCTARHIPVEVCENIIDQLYAYFSLSNQVENVRALRSCALVCKDWRVRSQMRLFYSVVLREAAAVHRFAVALGTGPHLREYVHEVILIGRRMQMTTSPLSHFPIVLHGKLPRLRTLHITQAGDSEDSKPEVSRPGTARRLRYVPLHPRFPLFLSAFTTITTISITSMKFQCFSDLAKIAIALPGLQRFLCMDVRCVTLGPLPACMKLQANSSGSPPIRLAPESMHLVHALLYRRGSH